MTVIAEILDIGPQRHGDLKRGSDDVVARAISCPTDGTELTQIRKSEAERRAYFEQMVGR